MDWAQSDTYFVPPTWRCIVKHLIQFHEKEAAELVEKLKMPDRYNFSYSTKEKRRLELKLSWSKRHQKHMRYAYNLDLAKATRWHGKCKETEQELLDDFMDDPDVQEGRTIILANRVKSCHQVRIDSLEQIENLKLK